MIIIFRGKGKWVTLNEKRFFHILYLLVLSLASDAVMLEDFKNDNVKSCIIYEMCIKEKCNSTINKYLSSFESGID